MEIVSSYFTRSPKNEKPPKNVSPSSPKNQKLKLDDSDFETPKPIKKLAPVFTKSHVTKAPRRKQTKKGKGGKKSSTMQKTLEDNFGRSDVNSEQLQMGIALSKSVQEAEKYNSDGEDVSSCIPAVQTTRENAKSTLEQFGFHCGRSKETVDFTKIIETTKRKKKSRYQYITPILYIRTQEDRENMVQTKAAMVLSHSTVPDQQVHENGNLDICSEALKKLSSDCKIFHMNNICLSELTPNIYYSKKIGLPKSEFQIGCLLKRWEDIPGRELSPPRINEEKNVAESIMSIEEKGKTSKISQRESFGISKHQSVECSTIRNQHSIIQKIEIDDVLEISKKQDIGGSETKQIGNNSIICDRPGTSKQQNDDVLTICKQQSCSEEMNMKIDETLQDKRFIGPKNYRRSPDLFTSSDDEFYNESCKRNSAASSFRKTSSSDLREMNGKEIRSEIITLNTNNDIKINCTNLDLHTVTALTPKVNNYSTKKSNVDAHSASLLNNLNGSHSFASIDEDKNMDLSDCEIIEVDNGICYFESFCDKGLKLTQKYLDAATICDDDNEVYQKNAKIGREKELIYNLKNKESSVARNTINSLDEKLKYLETNYNHLFENSSFHSKVNHTVSEVNLNSEYPTEVISCGEDDNKSTKTIVNCEKADYTRLLYTNKDNLLLDDIDNLPGNVSLKGSLNLSSDNVSNNNCNNGSKKNSTEKVNLKNDNSITKSKIECPKSPMLLELNDYSSVNFSEIELTSPLKKSSNFDICPNNFKESFLLNSDHVHCSPNNLLNKTTLRKETVQQNFIDLSQDSGTDSEKSEPKKEDVFKQIECSATFSANVSKLSPNFDEKVEVLKKHQLKSNTHYSKRGVKLKHRRFERVSSSGSDSEESNQIKTSKRTKPKKNRSKYSTAPLRMTQELAILQLKTPFDNVLSNTILDNLNEDHTLTQQETCHQVNKRSFQRNTSMSSSTSQESIYISDEELNYSSIHNTLFNEGEAQMFNPESDHCLIIDDDDNKNEISLLEQFEIDVTKRKQDQFQNSSKEPEESFKSKFCHNVTNRNWNNFENLSTQTNTPLASDSCEIASDMCNDEYKIDEDVRNEGSLNFGNAQKMKKLHPRIRELATRKANSKNLLQFVEPVLFNDTFGSLLEQSKVLNAIEIQSSVQTSTPEKPMEMSEIFKTPPVRVCEAENSSPELIIKTVNVTPMPNFHVMTTPEIEEHLSNFGLKKLKRRRGVDMLKYLYESTHPVFKDANVDHIGSESDDDKVVKRRRRLSMNCGNKFDDLVSNPAECVDIIGDTINLRELEEDMIFERKRSKKVDSCQVPLHITWHNFLAAHPEIRENVLLYNPLQVEDLCKMLKEDGFKYHIEDLISFLDKKCITIRTQQNQRRTKRSH